jgi:hypothetical protein
MFATAELSHGEPDSGAQPCPQAEDDNSAAKYLYELSRDVIFPGSHGKDPLHQPVRHPTERLSSRGIARW